MEIKRQCSAETNNEHAAGQLAYSVRHSSYVTHIPSLSWPSKHQFIPEFNGLKPKLAETTLHLAEIVGLRVCSLTDGEDQT